MKFVRTVLVFAAVVSAALAQEAPKPPELTKPAETTGAAASPGVPAVPAKAAPAPAAKAAPPKPVSTADLMRQSIEKQRAAAQQQREVTRKQAETSGAWLAFGAPPSHLTVFPDPEADCEPLADKILAPLIESNAKSQEVKPELLRAVMERESGYRPCAVSRKGAEGLMQLMPATAQEFGVGDVFDPKENVGAGAKLLKQLLDKYNGDLPKALAAYNAGAGAVDQAGGVPDIQETKDYVDAILKKLGITPPDPHSIQTPKPIGN
jgi:soluble lytic murein transglycosylase-like protein